VPRSPAKPDARGGRYHERDFKRLAGFFRHPEIVMGVPGSRRTPILSGPLIWHRWIDTFWIPVFGFRANQQRRCM